MNKKELEYSSLKLLGELKRTLLNASGCYPSYDTDLKTEKNESGDLYEHIWEILKENLYKRYNNGEKNLLWLIKEMNEIDYFIRDTKEDGIEIQYTIDAL